VRLYTPLWDALSACFSYVSIFLSGKMTVSRGLAIFTVFSGLHLAGAAPQSQSTEHTFDYVVVGGGPGGLTVASRLSEDPSVSVAIVEAGTWSTDTTGNQSQVPAYDFYYNGKSPNDTNPLADWGFVTTPQAVSFISHHFKVRNLTVSIGNQWRGRSLYSWQVGKCRPNVAAILDGKLTACSSGDAPTSTTWDIPKQPQVLSNYGPIGLEIHPMHMSLPPSITRRA
jgi:hypothetical protein